jgi:nitrite reductase/ring-hydroxylating ferredoxin subunit
LDTNIKFFLKKYHLIFLTFRFLEMKRSEFTKKTCPAILLTILGSTFLESCSNTSEEVAPIVPQAEQEYLDRLKSIGPSGFLLSQNKGYYNLKNNTYSKLLTSSNFINDLDRGVLLLRQSDTSLLVFDNCCPHLGTKNQWSLQGNKFKCGNHNNSYGIESGQIASCGSNSMYGNLRSFKSMLYKDLLTVDFS